ncbi:50S ribosomal protein L20 [Candidatus Aerophobetes bacterium]|uniref:Large ribosomal subunit protein bL20 n=1 Tax=Aerophobetes bacterium TaxID=2030807 RepID=A0A2A4YF20_UNCAE|nr:MAG: 50S ribosomal protein L20 [Candidatus Aerophobetes bacterium]
MVRVTCAVSSRRRRKKLLKQAKGFFGDRKNHLRQTKNALMAAMKYNYIHRKKKKSEFRRLWIIRIGVAAKINGISYNKLIHGLTKAGCTLNRKMLADMAIFDPVAFTSVADMAKKALVA